MANNQLLASDNFASGSLAAGWIPYFGLLKCQVIVGSPNVVEANTVNTQAGQIWTGLTWPNDHASEVTAQNLRTGTNSPFLLLHVRWQSGAASGYQANITNNTVSLFKFTAGASVQLGSTVSGLTFAMGDIWTFQAAGACISLYQNFKRVAYFYDATYTSGNPGFSIFDQTGGALTDCQVASWRGYSAVQQDGIWQKQGIVISANATDLTPDGVLVFGAFQNSKILFNGSKYTTLFASGVGTTGAGGNGNIYYADSVDGLTWNRSGSPVIANFTNPTLWFDGTTYHCYCQSISAVNGNIAHYTSPDMTATSTWTQRSANVLSPGSGLWDNTIFLLAVVDVVAGTWYALYTGNNASSQYKIGLATSTDGGFTWTKYVGNPVLVAASGGAIVGSQAVVKVNGKYYAWFYSNSPGQGNASAPFQDPFDAVRFSSSDLINWSVSTHSLRHSEQFEALNTNTGGAAPTAIIDISSKAHLYTLSSPGDAIGPQIYQTGLAIAPAPIASVITQNEDAVQNTANDTFSIGAGPLSSNWTTPTGSGVLKIVSGPFVEPTNTSTFSSAAYTGLSFGPNQYSEVTLHTLTGTLTQSFIGPMVRASLAAITDYEGVIAAPTGTSDAAASINKRVAGVATQIGPTIVCEPKVGDVWRLSVVTGNDGFPVLSLFQNGFLILQVQDQSSTPITSGSPGMFAQSSLAIADAQMSLWAGGNANVIPAYPSGASSSWLTTAVANSLRGLRGH